MTKTIIEFVYDNKTYFTSKLEKKLKKMNISKDDIQIIREFEEIDNNKQLSIQKNMQTVDDSVKLYYFYNPDTKETWSSIYEYEEFIKQIKWDEQTKTGLKYINDGYINKLICIDNPKNYPVEVKTF